MDKLIESLQSTLGSQLPGVLGAVVLLVIGWLIAVAIRTVSKKALSLCRLNQLVNSKTSGELDLEGGISTGLYYIALLFVLMAVFNQLGLEVASGPIEALITQLFDFIPRLAGGTVLAILAWVSGKIIGQIVSGSLGASGIDKRVSTGSTPLSQTLGNISNYLIILLFLPAILGVFELQGLLEPVQSMVDEITGMIPNVLGATIIIIVGWFIAKILRDITSNFLAAAGADAAGEKIGFKNNSKISSIIATVVHFLVFIPALIAGLNALEMTAIAQPATQMLNTVMESIPHILSAVAIVGITYFIARLVSGMLAQLSAAANVDALPSKLGFKSFGKNAVSNFIGSLTMFLMMLFATVEAANRLGFSQVSELVSMFIQFGGNILLGGAIIIIGLWIANLATGAMSKASSSKAIVGLIRVVILGLVFSMGLRAMGVANDIVNMAFGITLGATAIAVALAFGLGGRDAAAGIANDWAKSLKDGK